MKIYEYNFLMNKILEMQEEEVVSLVKNKENAYECFEIPKKQGTRVIHGLNRKQEGIMLRRLQKNLYKKFFSHIPISTQAKGFRKNENYENFLKPHVGKRFFIRMDIQDYFGSFKKEFIKEKLKNYVKDEKSIELIYEICTLEDKIPQGAVTSPMFTNILFSTIDQRIWKYCQAIENRSKKCLAIEYTRYADDLLFSSNEFDFEKHLSFFHMISKILGNYTFRINLKKTIVNRRYLAMNGYVIEKDIHLSRNRLKQINKILYFFKDKNKERYIIDKKVFLDLDPRELLKNVNLLDIKRDGEKVKFNTIQELTYYLSGYRAWIIAILQANIEMTRKYRDMEKILRRIEIILDELQKME